MVSVSAGTGRALSKILIMGGAGNMGRRYQSILKILGTEFKVFDPHDRCRYYATLKDGLEWCDGVIIATPTKVHYQNFMEVLGFSAKHVAILCEKPFSFNLEDVELCRSVVEREGLKFQMVNQYAEMPQYMPRETHSPEGWCTLYDYFHSGADGVFWDCINIIGMDRLGAVKLKNESPVWQCRINGYELARGDVDQSYISMVKKWIEAPTSNVDYMLAAHKKTVALIEESRGS